MSYADYNSRYYQRPRYESHYTPSRHHQPSAAKPTDMRYSNPYASSYSHSGAYEPRTSPPRRAAAQAYYRAPARKPSWPPSPCVEDEKDSLEKEASSSAASPGQGEGEPPINTRGTVDQEALLDDIEQPQVARESDSHLFASGTDDDATTRPNTVRDRRRRSYVERGNMPHIKTDVHDPPVFTERVRTPYGYSKPQKESTAPEPGDYLRSPEPMTPNVGTPRSVPSRQAPDSDKDDKDRHSRRRRSHSRRDSYTKSRPTSKEYVFDDTDSEESTTHLRTERKPARYSFVKSDLQREDLRTNLRDTQERPESRQRDSEQRTTTTIRKGDSAGSSRDTSYAQSPRSSSSSLNNGTRKSRPAPVEIGYDASSRPSSRPDSPLQRVPSPKLPTHLRESPPGSRPSSRGTARPASPLSSSTTIPPPSPSRGREPISEADWHSRFRPASTDDRSRHASRYSRHDTMPLPRPRIDVHSPSPARSSTADGVLPYPVDEHTTGVFMPPEEHYQFDHSTVASPKQTYEEFPRAPSPSVTDSSYTRDVPFRPAKETIPVPEDSPRSRRPRSNSARSQGSKDGRRDKPTRRGSSLDLARPLPSCPRTTASGRYDDWYSLRGCKNFDVCPSCYEGVFANTSFDIHFKQTRLYERPIERICDFSSPWARLAWLLIIKQGRQSLDLLYGVADVAEYDRPCPGDRELGTDRVTWYGIPDQRDGLHVASFAICSCDKSMIEALFPTLRGYLTKIPTGYHTSMSDRFVCSLRISSRRFPKYVDLLVELDEDAQSSGRRPEIDRFVQFARENAFKGECTRDKPLFRKPWHFISSLPEFTVCEECYDELVWPAMQSKSTPSSVPRLINASIQLVPGEDPSVGSSCCLYSSRMRRVWDVSVKEEDFSYLKRKVLERKKAEARLLKEKKELLSWLARLDRGTSSYERAMADLEDVKADWAAWE